MKPGSHFEEGCDASFQPDRAARRRGDGTEDLQQRGFAGSIAPEDADHLPLLDVEIHIPKRPKHVWPIIRFLAAKELPPPVGHEGLPAQFAQAITLGKIFDSDGYRHF